MPKPLVRATDYRVGAERIALVQELGTLAVGEAVRRQQVLGHVRVEAGAEDAEVAFGDEGQRGRGKGEQGDRPPAREAPAPPSSRFQR